MNETNRSSELYHYGVLGMKWGIRRNPSTAYAKATKKKEKLQAKAAKYQVKAAKKAKKATDKISTATSNKKMMKGYKIQAKANKLALKSAKRQKKAVKWEKKMRKAFEGYDLNNLPTSGVKKGKDFVDAAKNSN